jgi:hypothetical protein
MLIIEHRVNTIAGLQGVPREHGVEIDVRHDPATNQLYLSHDLVTGDILKNAAGLEEYFELFVQQKNAFVVINIKEAGTEKHFLLDVEFPFLYAATRGTRADGFKTRAIAVRYSEAEPIEMALMQQGLVDWVWIDTNTILPLDEKTASSLAPFKTCLVSPDRWRPDKAAVEIPFYREQIAKIGFRLDAVMVGKEYISLWK